MTSQPTSRKIGTRVFVFVALIALRSVGATTLRTAMRSITQLRAGVGGRCQINSCCQTRGHAALAGVQRSLNSAKPATATLLHRRSVSRSATVERGDQARCSITPDGRCRLRDAGE